MGRKQNQVWYDEPRVRKAFEGAKTMTEVIGNMGQAYGSASYLHVKRAAERYGLGLPTGKYDNSAAVDKIRRPLEEILVEKSTYSNRQSLKRKLIVAGLKQDVCEVCGIGPTWNNQVLVLQLDHINGVGDDNRLENIRIICPNCHTQTDTFAYRGGRQRVAGIPC